MPCPLRDRSAYSLPDRLASSLPADRSVHYRTDGPLHSRPAAPERRNSGVFFETRICFSGASERGPFCEYYIRKTIKDALPRSLSSESPGSQFLKQKVAPTFGGKLKPGWGGKVKPGWGKKCDMSGWKSGAILAGTSTHPGGESLVHVAFENETRGSVERELRRVSCRAHVGSGSDARSGS